MTSDWQELTRLTRGREMVVERVRLADSDIAIEGRFTPPPLAMLPAEEQVFVAAFVQCHGSIKRMEELFGISYPTVKGRLRRIAAALPSARVEVQSGASDVLDRLERGEISADQAEEMLRR